MAKFKNILPPTPASLPSLKNACFVGIDQSFTGTGLIVLDSEGNVQDDTVISTKPASTPLGEIDRITGIFKQIYTFVNEAAKGREIAAVQEDFAYNKTNRMAEIGGLGWHIRIMMSRTPWHFGVAAPTTVKKFATGKGNAGKSGVILSVYKRWGYETEDDNLADAFVLAKMSWMMFGRVPPGTSGTRKTDFECISKIKVYK